MKKKPRLAYLRPDQTLSDYEMGYVGLLDDEFDLSVITVGEPAMGGISLPVIRERWPDRFVAGGKERSLLNAFYSRFLKRRYHIPNIRRHLKNAQIVQGGEAAGENSYQAACCKQEFDFSLLLSVSENLSLLEKKSPHEQKRLLFTLSRTDHVFAISHLARERIVEIGFPDERITVIGHGIDCERFSPSGRVLASGPLRIGFCGRFRSEKGLDFLLKAVPSLESSVILQGAGPQEAFLRENAPGNVRFLPPRPYRENHLFYKEIDIFVLPSIPIPGLVEQYGFVLIEAMASGVPIVASDIGGIPEVVGNCAILVPPASPDHLRSALSRLLNDSELRRSLAHKGRQRARKLFRREDVAERMRRVYRNLCHTSSPSSVR